METPSEVSAFLTKLPIEDIYGVGAVMAKRLHQIRVRTLGDAAAMARSACRQHWAP